MLTLTKSVENRIIGHFSPEFLAQLRQRFLEEQVRAAVLDGRIPWSDVVEFCALHDIALVSGAALAFFVTNAVARGMLKNTGTTFADATDAGTAAVIEIYNGTAPADADATESNTLLASLTCAATAFSGDSDGNPGGVLTFGTITQDSSADATGTASHFRIKTQTGGTVICQGSVGTATTDLVLNTVSITSGSAVSITSGTVTLPEG